MYYVDLLIPIADNEEAYTDFNESNGERYQISKDSEIVKYNVDGFRSYTFHFIGADSKMQINDLNNSGRDEYVCFANSPYSIDMNKMQYEIVESKYRKIKLAALDEQGNVLQVSEAKYIRPNHWTKTRWSIDYDIGNNKLEVEFYEGIHWGFLGVWLYFIPVIIAIIVIYLIDKTRVYLYNKYHNGTKKIHINYLKTLIYMILEIAIWILCMPNGAIVINLYMFGGLIIEKHLLAKMDIDLKRIKYILLIFNGLIGYIVAWILYMVVYFA